MELSLHSIYFIKQQKLDKTSSTFSLNTFSYWWVHNQWCFCVGWTSSLSQEVLEGSHVPTHEALSSNKGHGGHHWPWGCTALSSREIRAAGSRPICHLLLAGVSLHVKRDKEVDDRAGSSHASWVTFTSSQFQMGLRKRRLKSDSMLVWISHNFDGKPWAGERIHHRHLCHRSPEEAWAWRWWERGRG